MSVVLADSRDHLPVRRMSVLAHDGRELTLEDLTWIEASEPAATLRTAAE